MHATPLILLAFLAQTPIALSPDGRNLVARLTTDGFTRLWVRPLERVTGTVLGGTDFGTYPFWDPSGRYILYTEADPKTKRDLWVLPQTHQVPGNAV